MNHLGSRRRGPGFRLRALAAFALLCSGCLGIQETEIRAERAASGGRWRYGMTLFQIVSDASTDSGRAADFDDLVRMWKGDEFAADEAKRGRRVISRKLRVEDGRLIGQVEEEVNRTADLFADDDNWRVDARGYHMKVDESDSVIATDGVIHRTDGETEITWPRDARRITVRFATKGFRASDYHSLVPLFEAHAKKNPAPK